MAKMHTQSSSSLSHAAARAANVFTPSLTTHKISTLLWLGAWFLLIVLVSGSLAASNQQIKQESSSVRVCGKRLTDLLSLLCMSRGGYNGVFKRSEAFSLLNLKKRGVVEECCRKACTVKQLTSYCAKDLPLDTETDDGPSSATMVEEEESKLAASFTAKPFATTQRTPALAPPIIDEISMPTNQGGNVALETGMVRDAKYTRSTSGEEAGPIIGKYEGFSPRSGRQFFFLIEPSGRWIPVNRIRATAVPLLSAASASSSFHYGTRQPVRPLEDYLFRPLNRV